MTAITLRRRLDRIPIPQSTVLPTYDLSRLTDDQFDRLDVLRERLVLVGEEGLSAGEMEEIAALVGLLTVETAR